MAKILVVEDEIPMLMGIRDNLEFEGYEVETAQDGEEGLQKAHETPYDLIISDVMMPKMSGFDFCKKLRAEDDRTPFIMLTAKGEEIDRVLGLELGADDYITKPFSLRELLARVKAVLRRVGASTGKQETGSSPNRNGDTRTIGRLTIDFDAYTATDGDGNEVSMSHKEYVLLKYLSEHARQAVSRDDLLTHVWNYEDAPTTRTVDNFILKLRQKIEPKPAKPRHLLTVHGVGYKFIP